MSINFPSFGRENKRGAVWGPLTLKPIYQEIASFHFSTTRFVRETMSFIRRAIHVGTDLTVCHRLNVSVSIKLFAINEISTAWN